VVGIEAFDVDTELSLSGRSLERPARYLRIASRNGTNDNVVSGH